MIVAWRLPLPRSPYTWPPSQWNTFAFASRFHVSNRWSSFSSSSAHKHTFAATDRELKLSPSNGGRWSEIRPEESIVCSAGHVWWYGIRCWLLLVVQEVEAECCSAFVLSSRAEGPWSVVPCLSSEVPGCALTIIMACHSMLLLFFAKLFYNLLRPGYEREI